jgi:thiamine pyrophosphokinase
MKRAIILLGGAKKIPERRQNDFVICADSGFISAVDYSIKVDHLVGDMDSLPPHYLKIARQMGIDIQVYEKDKDLSDGEIALNLALSKGCRKIVISGGKRGRFDHVLSTLFLPFLSDTDVEIEILMDDDIIHLIRSGTKREFSGKWRKVSIIPITEESTISTNGLKWPLRSEMIRLGSTRGIHNEPISDTFSIECTAGCLFVVLSDPDLQE